MDFGGCDEGGNDEVGERCQGNGCVMIWLLLSVSEWVRCLFV